MHNSTVKLTVKCVISILKNLRPNQDEIEWSLICHRNLAQKNHWFSLKISKIEITHFTVNTVKNYRNLTVKCFVLTVKLAVKCVGLELS